MHRLRLLWGFAPLLVGACSLLNAPAEIDVGSGGGGTAGTGATGGSTSSSGGSTTTTTTSTGTPTGECGDGKVQADEGCDDDNTALGDGCNAKCEIEDGFTCTADLNELSICTKLCGNGTLEAGEECDDKGAVDMTVPEGDQDFCTAECKFKEFDIEAAKDVTAHNQNPTAGFRATAADGTSFVAFWHSAAAAKVLSRAYKFNGEYAKGSASVDVALSGVPDPTGPAMCTAASNRSIIVGHDQDDGQLHWRKVDSDNTLTASQALSIPSAQPRPSCAHAPDPINTLIAVTMGKSGGALWDVYAQAYASSALPQGPAIDIGDALSPNTTTSWGLTSTFLVAWIADPVGGGPIVAQQLDQAGALQAGFSYTLTDVNDVRPREPHGARTQGNRFALVYTTDSLPDMNGNTHRELLLRMFDDPTTPNAPQRVAAMDETTDQSEPAIAVNPVNGRFVIVWTAGPVTNRNIFYRTYDEKGTALMDAPALANVNLPGQQTQGAPVVDPVSGNVAIIWDNFVTNSGKPHKISARLFFEALK